MDRNIRSSVRNTLKTYMPPAKPVLIILYHADHPEGKTFEADIAEESYDEMVKDGWVDTPAKLDLPKVSKKIETKADTSMTTPQLVKACKSAGFHVMNDIELEQTINKAIEAMADKPDPEPLINRYIQSPTDLTKEELIVLGADYKLKLRMTMKEQTMIGHIAQAIEDAKSDP